MHEKTVVHEKKSKEAKSKYQVFVKLSTCFGDEISNKYAEVPKKKKIN